MANCSNFGEIKGTLTDAEIDAEETPCSKCIWRPHCHEPIDEEKKSATTNLLIPLAVFLFYVFVYGLILYLLS